MVRFVLDVQLGQIVFLLPSFLTFYLSFFAGFRLVLLVVNFLISTGALFKRSLYSELVFVMPTDESARAPTRFFDLASASGVNVLGSFYPPPLTTSSSKSGNRGRHWLNILNDDNPQPRKRFSEDSARKFDVVVDLLVASGPSSVAIADAILRDCISPRRPSPARLVYFRDFDRAGAAASRVPGLNAVSASVPERSDRRLPPVANALSASSLS